MKKLLFAAAAFITVAASAQRLSPHDTVTAKHVKVTYGRPYKKGREIFGKLEPYGVVYRLGADEATTITFDKDVKFGGAGVKAGTYTMFAIPNESEWTIILNSQLGQWGAFKYQQYKDKDVAQVKASVTVLDHVVEQLTISFPPNSNMMRIEWDKTRVDVPVSL